MAGPEAAGVRRTAVRKGGQGIPEIDQLMKKGQDQLRVLMGGRGGQGGRPGGGGGGGFEFNRITIGIAALVAVGLWLFASFYTVRPDERSVELLLGDFQGSIGEPGLNFAPWPIVRAEVIPVTTERTVAIGVNRGNRDEQGLMLTGDENVVDIDFQVVWNVSNPAEFLFNLRDPEATIRAVSESAMREIVAQSQLAPILNRDRGVIAERLRELIQSTLDSYDSGVAILRVNFDRADPPRAGHRRFPRGAGGRAAARPAPVGGRRLCQPGSRGRSRGGRAAPGAGRGLPRARRQRGRG